MDSINRGGENKITFSLFYLNALYNPLNKNYIDVDFQKRKSDERQSLCQMIDEREFKEDYPMILRVVRVKLDDNSYESLTTNLDTFQFKTEDIKSLYHLR